MKTNYCLILLFTLTFGWSFQAVAQEEPKIRHAVLIAGGFTGIIDEEGREVWKTRGGARDATRLANGHILITYRDEVVEFDAGKEVAGDTRRMNPMRNWSVHGASIRT